MPGTRSAMSNADRRSRAASRVRPCSSIWETAGQGRIERGAERPSEAGRRCAARLHLTTELIFSRGRWAAAINGQGDRVLTSGIGEFEAIRRSWCTTRRASTRSHSGRIGIGSTARADGSVHRRGSLSITPIANVPDRRRRPDQGGKKLVYQCPGRPPQSSAKRCKSVDDGGYKPALRRR